jgi:hypothetical protein
MGYLGARGKMIHEKNLNWEISCKTPFERGKGYSVQTNSFRYSN